MFIFKIILSILLSLCNIVNSANILGVFPFASTSHYILGRALMRGLAEAGHNVTMISAYEEKEPPKRGSYRDVVLTGFIEDHKEFLDKMSILDNKNQSTIDTFKNFVKMMTELNTKFFDHENVQNLLKSSDKFDVVIIEHFFNDAMKILGHIYNIPTVAFHSMGATILTSDMVGSPMPISYIPMMESNFTPNMSFFQRLMNMLQYISGELVFKYLYFPHQNRILKEYFTNPPDIFDLYQNVSLVLLNSHESVNQAVPTVPNLLQIGGFHVEPPKRLPKELQDYLDNAKEGVVYFSLGSNLKSKDLPEHKRDAILKALGKLKQKVLWKWEDVELPGKPANVKLGKWFPQGDILAHPNVKLFISHCGLLSTIETVYHGVPMLGIPVFADQHNNAKLAVANGYALSLPYKDPSFSEEKLSELLEELLTNPRYMENIKRRSRLFHDRPIKPMDSAIYWVEYVIRNGGASHLKVAGVDLPWFIYHSLDVVSFMLIFVTLIIHLLYLSFKKLSRFCSLGGRRIKTKKD